MLRGRREESEAGEESTERAGRARRAMFVAWSTVSGEHRGFGVNVGCGEGVKGVEVVGWDAGEGDDPDGNG